KQVRDFYRSNYSPEGKAMRDALEKLRNERAELDKAIPVSLVLEDMPTRRDAHVLIRGAYDKKGPKVERGVPAVLSPLPDGAPDNRLGLAQWLVAPDHPLTARVTVSRFWQQYFGAGIVRT